ncbi:MAG: hypothetical protein HYV42_05010 [Candidatus Magasanikbacteria bacterium]|nr:hypothetical protein [Candidatus Magasanikbacteria bacterium]
MKVKFLIFGLILLAGVGYAMIQASAAATTKGMVVHEWGTFTTLHATDGTRLSGLYFDEEQLPRFTYQHGDFTKRAEAVYNAKGFDISPTNEPKNVTVKMETPVIYFYSKKAQNATVQVDFPQGIISQWYPQNTSGNKMHDNWDFTKPYKGGMKWKVRILPPNSTQKLTPPEEEETKIWTSPRVTDANLIKSHKREVEKFIFYRGVANFDIPVETKFTNDNELVIKNNGPHTLSQVFVYEKKTDGSEYIWWNGEMKNGTEQKINFGVQSPAKADFAIFERALMDGGLYKKEAKAMLATWEQSYFKHPGLRIFWIVPEQKTNELLPLKISPKPTETKRVFMGRIDLLTPTFEKELLQAYQQNSSLKRYSLDRYYKAYIERAE